jgi:CheY-like chemotaxis protein
VSEGAKKILVVEDEADIRESLQEILECEGYRVEGAANGHEALEKIAKGPLPHVILLDLMMPIMNGAEFRQSQVRNPLVAHIPVVVMSADNRTPERTRELGISHYVKKPLDIDALIDKIKECCAP